NFRNLRRDFTCPQSVPRSGAASLPRISQRSSLPRNRSTGGGYGAGTSVGIFRCAVPRVFAGQSPGTHLPRRGRLSRVPERFAAGHAKTWRFRAVLLLDAESSASVSADE